MSDKQTERGVVHKIEIPTDLLGAAEYILDMRGAGNQVDKYKEAYYDGVEACAEILKPAIAKQKTQAPAVLAERDRLRGLLGICGGILIGMPKKSTYVYTTIAQIKTALAETGE